MRKSNPVFLGFILILSLIWLFFKNGSTTIVDFIIDKSEQTVLIYLDKNKITSTQISEPIESITITNEFYETFTPKEIKQKTKLFSLNDKTLSTNTNSLIIKLKDQQKNSVKTEISNIENVKISIWINDKNTISFFIKPLRDNYLSVEQYQNGQNITLTSYRNIPLSAVQQFKKIGMILTSPFPIILTLLLLLYVLKYSIQPKNIVKYKNESIISILIVGLSIFAFFWLYYLHIFYGEGIPHVGDAITYLMQGRFLANGGVCADFPLKENLYDFFKAWNPLFLYHGKWCGYYPFGHPLLLSIGVIIGNPASIPPLLGALSVLIIYSIGRKVFGVIIGFISSLLLAISPFFQMNAASFMSHNTALFYELVGIMMLIKGVLDKKVQYLILSGIFFGLVFNTRSFTAVALIIPLLIYLILSKVKLKNIILFGISFFASSSLYFVYNFAMYGHLWKTPYLQNNTFLFSYQDIVVTYILSIQTHLMIFLSVLHGWPYILTVFLLLVSLVYIRSKEYIFFLLSGLSISLIWGIPDGGTHIHTYGSRFWFEILPFVIIMLALSIQYFLVKITNIYFKIVLFVIFVILVCYTSLGWIFETPRIYTNIEFTPSSIKQLKTFNYTDARLIKKAQEMNIHNAVIFVKDCKGNWWCYGSVLPQNNPQLNSDIVWALDLGQQNKKLQQEYKNRKFFFADYDSGQITPL